MQTITLLSQKGGVGKSVLWLHRSVAAERDGKTPVIVDLDPQASAATWKDLRQDSTPHVQPAQPSRLVLILAEAEKHGAEFAVIDTSPNSESASLTAARAADLILIPCRPHLLDLKAISNSIEIARMSGKPYAVVLNAVPTRGSLTTEATAAIASYGAPICPIQIGSRAAFYHCLVAGQVAQEYEPLGKAAEEAHALYTWTAKQLAKLSTRRHA